MNISQTLRFYRKRAALSQAALSKISGVAQSAISDAENDQRELTISSLEKLCNAFSVSLIDFLSVATNSKRSNSSSNIPSSYMELTAVQKEIIDSLIKELTQKNVTFSSDGLTRKSSPNGSIEVLSPVHIAGEAAAGHPLYDEAFSDEFVDLPAKYADQDHYRIIRARGNSMEPKIYSGDIVVAEIDVEPFDGQMALVFLAGLADDEYTIKRVYKEHGKAILRSYNSEYPDMIYDLTAVRSCERVVEVVPGSRK